jgi:ankyrin repeat protein
MKQLLITTIAAVVLVGCGESKQSAPAPETKPEPLSVKAPAISIRKAAWKAAWDGNIKAVKQHIAAGVDVDEKDYMGETSLHYAADKGHKEIVSLLIAKGADVNTRDDVGRTPLDWAATKSKKETADLIRKHGGKTGAELEAAGKPVEPVAEAVKSESTTVKAPDISIHDAAFKGNIEAVKQHLAAGTDVNAKNDWSEWTPLHRAAEYNHKEIAELLIAKGADVNPKDENGYTPLDWADDEIVDLLRKHGGKTAKELKAEEK